METIRPVLETLRCPPDYTPCSDFTTPDETVCMNEISLCPIIELLTASDEEVADYLARGFEKTKSISSLTSEDGV